MRKILAGIMLSMFICSSALAETVVVTGTGATREAAVNDAKRNAVEKVVGTYISSNTIVNTPYVLKDEIYAKAYGFVKDIQILQETNGSVYTVTAKVDVDSSPNSQLMNKLETIKVLNDPRISVVINHNTKGEKSAKYISLCETIITDKLRELGFTKIVDKAKVWQKKNEGRGGASISKKDGVKTDVTVSTDTKGNVTNTQTSTYTTTTTSTGKEPVVETKQPLPELPKPGPIDYAAYLPNSDTDYFVFGSLEFATDKVMHPKYSTMREEKADNYDTGFLKTTASLEIKILKSDSMEQVGMYSFAASSMHSDTNVAERRAVKAVAGKAAEKIAESFKQKGAAIASGFQLEVRIEHDNLEKFQAEVNKAAGINNLRLRNYTDGKAYYEIEGELKPFELFKHLQQTSRYRITKLNLSDNLLEIMVA